MKMPRKSMQITKLPPPEWLQGVSTPGEAAHAGKDFASLWSTRRGLLGNDARVTFSVNHVNGSARLGMRLLTVDQWKRARASNSAIIRSGSNLPGADLHIGFQPQYLYETLQESWIANSSFLTADLWDKFKNFKTIGGATVFFCLSNQYRSNVKHCTLMHGTLITRPHTLSDGPRQFLEVNYNPNMVDGLDTTIVDHAFANALRNQQVNRDPVGPFEQLMAGSRLHPALANADLVWGGSLENRDPLSVYWPPATARNGKQRPIILEGALVFKLDAQQHSALLRLLAFMNASYDAGYMVTNNAHDDANSCLRTTLRALAVAMMHGNDHHVGDHWPTDVLISHFANLASERLWINVEGDAERSFGRSGHSIIDIESFEMDAAKISPRQFMSNVRSILCHPTMKAPFSGENSYNTTYMCKPIRPHPAREAQAIYHADAELALELLEQKAARSDNR